MKKLKPLVAKRFKYLVALRKYSEAFDRMMPSLMDNFFATTPLQRRLNGESR